MKNLGKCAAAFVVIALFALVLHAPAAEARMLQLGHCDTSSPDNGYQILAVEFNRILGEKSGGKFGLEIYGDSILGGERDLMEGLNLCTIDLAIVSNMYVSNFVDDFKVFDLPYIFSNYNEAVAILSNKELLKPMTDKLLSDNNTIHLGAGTIGFRSVINTKRAINVVDDLKGMKIRVPETPSLVKTFQALGANPTTTAWSEAFTAVQQKTVDGLEVTTSIIYTGRYWEICTNLSLTRHLYQPLHLMINAPLWDSLSTEEQGWFASAAEEASVLQVKRIEEMEKSQLDDMDAKGCKVNAIPDIEPFRKACAPVYDYIKDIIGAEIVERVQDMVAELN